ncbi:hypothetical protein C173_24217 [Paenibacillus sp. FSL R7-277]|nr:hypothetical protein C173_24217 [Paenibacillus sp. FSL R7-277]
MGCPFIVPFWWRGFTSADKTVKIVIVSNFPDGSKFVNEIDLSFAGRTLLSLTKGGILILREMDFTKIQGAKGGEPDVKTTNRRYWLGGNGQKFGS